MNNFIDVIAGYDLTESEYQACLADIADKINKNNDYEWQDIVDKYNLGISPDTLRKASSTIFGGKFVAEYLTSKIKNVTKDDIDVKIQDLRRERMKLQAINIERNRLDRSLFRQELFYENVGRMIKELPVPDFKICPIEPDDDIEYLVAISDIHAGARFKTENNEYSPEITKERFEYLLSELIDFVMCKNITNIKIVSLGDTIQGALRVSDIKLNDSTVVESVVMISRIIAWFLNELSAYTHVEYYPILSANHTENRILGVKPGELAGEDMEYIIAHYISDTLKNNKNITVNIDEECRNYIMFDINGHTIFAAHGHRIKGLNDLVKRASSFKQKFITTVLIGHQHSAKEFVSHSIGDGDAEVIVAPSFIGSDPYSNSLMLNSKAAVCIYGYSSQGHTETKKIILN